MFEGPCSIASWGSPLLRGLRKSKWVELDNTNNVPMFDWEAFEQDNRDGTVSLSLDEPTGDGRSTLLGSNAGRYGAAKFDREAARAACPGLREFIWDGAEDNDFHVSMYYVGEAELPDPATRKRYVQHARHWFVINATFVPPI